MFAALHRDRRVRAFWQVFGKLDAKSPREKGWIGQHQTDRPGARSGGITG
jgi:hypothetical protein